jgi:tRNA wybutosine-synthesizing protein 4
MDFVTAFGANMLSLGPSHGFLFGGMRQDGMICHGFWRWRLGIVNEKVTGIAFTNATASLDVSIGIHPYMGRFGATASIIGGSVLVIGGIASPGVIPRKYETLSITGDFLNSKGSVHDTGLSVTAVEPDRQHNWPRPFLVGHSSVTTIRGNVLVVGGGAVCFSFGTSWNSGSWLIHDGTTRPATAWALLDLDAPPSPLTPLEISSPISERNGSLKPISRSTLATADEVRNIMHQPVPKVFESINIGPCLDLWTLDYLKEKIGTEREVIVHHSPSRSMNFQAKNFKYVKQSFGDFLDLAARGAHLYLRSISSDKPAEKPAVLAEDFPEIANDFRLPPEILSLVNNFHSSALRISSDVNMWLHYDVMANFYCQIRGNRRLVIYPPSDITRLDFPPGSTTSRLGLFDTNGSSSQFDGIPGTSPIEAALKPGDVLFIPPLWPHSGSPEGGVSIAVNVFFRNLPVKDYAAGRDVYGNRDLQPYEDGRRDLEKIVRRFDHDVPADIAQAYLNRLADELKARAARFVA